MTTSQKIIRFDTKNPRNNLPLISRRKRTELLFQSTFIKSYVGSIDEPGLGGSQFEIPGCGIADFIWVNRDGAIDAFEFKMKDWKRGATQASRYRAYAARTILVMPSDAVVPALRFIESFQAVDLGLWSFDPKNGKIVSHHTPFSRKPHDPTASEKATAILSRKRHFRLLCESV